MGPVGDRPWRYDCPRQKLGRPKTRGFGDMRVRAGSAATTALTAVVLVLGAAPAAAHQSPPGCNSNSLTLIPDKDRTLVRNGDVSSYKVTSSNDVGSACDVTGATMTLTLPAADGTPTGQSVTLASGADFPSGAAARLLGTVPYTVAVNPGVTDAVARATAVGTLHDAPTDHAAEISKTLGTTVTQPSATLVEAVTPSNGPAPLPVTYTYTVTNDSRTNAPLSGVRVVDDKCATVTYTGGDTNGNSLLDVGEVWTYTCTATLTTPGTVTSTATAEAVNTVDSLPVAVAPKQVAVTVTQAPTATALGRLLPPVSSPRARRAAPCISVPRSLSVRAREVTLVRVRVQDEGRAAANSVVRITGPGFVLNKKTNAEGRVTFRVRPRRTGTLVIQSAPCSGADRVSVLRARQVNSQRVPRVTG